MKINLGKILVKTIGVGTVAAVGYDAYKRAKWKGEMDQKNAAANVMTHFQMTTQSLDTNSAVRASIQNGFNKWSHEKGIKGYFSGVKGFCSGFVSSLADNVVPLALAVGTLMFNKAGKYCAWGLGLYAAKFVATDLLGLGKPNYFPERV